MCLRWMESGNFVHTISGDKNAKIYLDRNGFSAHICASDRG